MLEATDVDRSERSRVTVHFPAALDVQRWERDHDAGEVPSRWPYGLDGLRSGYPDVKADTLPSISSLWGKVARLLPQPLPGRTSDGRDVGLCWDENTAIAMTRLARHREMYCGVVWVTDRLDSRDAAARNTLRSLRAMTGIWVLSRAQVEPLRELLGPCGPPVSFVPFGVDHRFFVPRTYPERPVVISLGNDRHRDTDTMLEALRSVKRRRPGTEVVIQSRSMAPGDANGVTVVGRMSHRQVRDLYGRASVVAVATRPNLHVSGMTVALEAMASGRPVVITGSPGMGDYVQHERTGLITAQGDAAALADAITNLLDHERLASAMGSEGRSVVERRMTTDHLVRGLTSVLGSPVDRAH